MASIHPDPLGDVPKLSHEPSFDDEKKGYGIEAEKSLDSPDSERGTLALGSSEHVNGEPIISTGEDVSNYLVDVHDVGGEALTFRSIVLGTILSGFGASVTQARTFIYSFKPLPVSVSSIFLLLVIYSAGRIWARFPTREYFDRHPRLKRYAAIVHFLNPGEFGMKEHAVATFISTTASAGSTAVNNFAVQRLFYNTNPNAVTAVLATFSTACFGYGLVGLLRPLTVYPSYMVFWASLPSVTVFQTLHHDKVHNKEITSKRVRYFWYAVAGMAIYEILPAYIFPLLNGISIICLATQNAPPHARSVISYIFGGANSNEGLGVFEFSFDWQYLGSYYMSVPLIQQVNTWVGIFFGYFALLGIYYANTWNAKNFPFLSTAIFDSQGNVYNQSFVFGPDFNLNRTALAELGPPYLAGGNVLNNMAQNWAIGGLIAHVTLFWGKDVIAAFKLANARKQPDRHWIAMQKYKEAPMWWYAVLLVLSFFAGLIVIFKGNTTLPWWGYLVALSSGAIIAPFSTALFGRMGNGIATNQLFKMIAGAIHPGKPVANLYFAMWSHDVVSTSVNLAGDLKLGQYLKIPPRVMFITQVYGTILGAVINYVVMQVITTNKRAILLDPIGDNQWSGFGYQSLNSNAVTWSLAGQVYGIHSLYRWVPLGLILGAIPVVFQWLISRRVKKIGPLSIDKIILPYSMGNIALLGAGINSTVWSSIILAIVSQVYLRRYKPKWFRNFNYLIGGGLDGGAQITIFILTFAVYGASGTARPFPTWWGNTDTGNIDYCLHQRKGG
ncbi:oligopeptide transporter [Exidia glandulosa HHB12029]|uniref:Oligopeptide transporter n=1 Tax=Exidia glandulosa HHB12029 TaxID=1314781 RepID=A0A165D1V1_EXIGL|nr:oligopeptide transporter [Exidia glandulosa HHB12029]